MTTVRDLMNTRFPTVLESSTVVEAAKRMLAGGRLPVVDDDGNFKGVVWQADIVRAVASGKHPATIPLATITSGGESISPDASAEDADELFRSLGVNWIPVVEAKRLIGGIARADVDVDRRLRSALGERATSVSMEISPNDEMYAGQRGIYLLAGVSALECIRAAMAETGIADIGSILDLGCGHGRVLRVLKAGFPGASLTACDIDRDGVDFCVGAFGAAPVYSAVDPDRVEIQSRFDLIWSGSLFTHLDAERWRGFLSLSGKCLAPGGLFVFTAQGRRDPIQLRKLGVPKERAEVMLDDYERTGFTYAETPPATECWGIALASRSWIEARISKQQELRMVSFRDSSWQPPAPRQDVIACTKT
jgi:CBS domain-containing protein/SAM-dependent methyltransferase